VIERFLEFHVATAPAQARIPGCGFLLQDAKLADVFTPEDFSEQHRLIAQTADDFCNNEIVPNATRWSARISPSRAIC